MKRVAGVVFLGLSFVLASCVTRGDIEEIKESQKKILEKIEKGGMAARPQPPQQQRPAGPDMNKTYAVPVGDRPIKGSADAWVTVIEISEFQCPFCKRVGPTMKGLQEKYGADLRFSFAHNPLPFHNRAMPTAMAAECAREQGKFWEMHDALFDGQPQLEDANIDQYAQKIGVDMGKFKKCYADEKYKDRINEDMRLVTGLGARGTPAFFINGRFLSGAQPQAAFESIIDEELKKAKASGLSRKEYYAKAVEEKGEKKL